ncbi:MAG: putative zinc-binding metallopeptidase [Rhodoferax sp.]|nr:putative zinc-binding metallopeptidase [Rhodoferax sp.]
MNASSDPIGKTDASPGLRVRAFNCQCGSPIFFRNSECLACGTALGYAPELAQVVPLAETDEPDVWVRWETDGPRYQRCANLGTPSACNWLVPVDEVGPQAGLCRACRLNRTIPDLNDPQHPDNGVLWARIEMAKRRLVSALLVLGLPVASRESEDTEHGLMFDFLRAPDGGPPVMTGHDDGLITLNIIEADDVHRERARTNMNEPYRTLVGHLRHEVGHYYWNRLIADSHWLEPCRALFGDETLDYGDSLKRYYENGPPPDWQLGYVSAYATAHPWEDWAECWAHYMHMSDMVDTATSYGLVLDQTRLELKPFGHDVLYQPDHPGADKYLAFINHWAELTMLMNGMARAMGQPDIYPFVLAHQVVAKLHFIHLVVSEERHRGDDAGASPSPSQSQSQS